MKDKNRLGLFLDIDERPQRGGWAPGNYLGKCIKCDIDFVGDKRACHCAPCAYGDNKEGKDSERA